MDAKRLYFGLLGVLALLLLALAGGAYEADNLLSQRANTLLNLKAKNQALTQEQVKLVQAKKDVQKYADLEKIAKVVVPEDKDQAEAVREIVNIAANNGVALGVISFPASSLGTSSSSSSLGSTGTTLPPTASSPTSSTNKLSQLVAVKGLPGVYQLTINITGDTTHPVTYNQVINFLKGLENDRRTAQVQTINLQPVADSPGRLTFTLTLNEYIKP